MSVFLATVAGLATSMLIEILQGLMPSRDSTVFDVLFNTTGALFGGFLGLLIGWMVTSHTRTKEGAAAFDQTQA